MKLNAKQLYQFLSEHIQGDSNKILKIEDKEIWRDNREYVFEMMTKSYEKSGGFKTAPSAKKLWKNTDLVKAVLDKNEIVSCSLYRKIDDGYKMHDIGCNQTENGKFWIKEIIKDDINHFDEWYWCEVSGPVEHLFVKFNGYQIPNKYAKDILGVTSDGILEPLEDGFHYKLPIGEDREIFTKCIFGFPNQEIYNQVVKDIEETENFVKNISQKTVFEAQVNLGLELNRAILLYKNLYRLIYDNCYYELPPSFEIPYNQAKEVIGKAVQSNLYSKREQNIIKDYYKKILMLRDDFEPLVLHKTKMKLL